MPAKKDHALVLGGSMAGLLAARVLADHFTRVTLVERDVLPTEPGEHRRGVPQGRHTHGLLASGGDVIEKLFPGISEELAHAGAVRADVVERGRWFHEGACLCQTPSGLTATAASRPFLEGYVRQRVRRVPNITILEDTQAAGLLATPARDRVTGIVTGRGQQINAGLVIDSTGRGSRGPDWLESLGYPRPREERMEVALAYATRFFARDPRDLAGDIAVVCPPTPEGKRGGVLLAQEGNRWTVTLIGHHGQRPPTDLAGFIAYAETLPAPYIAEVIRRARPLDEGSETRYPASTRRHYEELARFPQGYLPLGDSICSFNPIYGQGMSVAALEAIALGQWLEQGGNFLKQAAALVDIPWAIAAGNDLRMKETTGERPLPVRVINWYMSHLFRAAHSDAELSLAFHRVGNLLAPPPSVMAPRLAWRVLKGALRRRFATGSTSAPRARRATA